MGSAADKAKGLANEAMGNVKQGVGKATGSRTLEAEGKVQELTRIIAEIAAENGLIALPSATNFVAVDCGGDGVFARAVLEGLVARGVFVRMPGAAPLDRCLRVTAGRASDLAHFAEALPGALADARKG